MTDRNPMLKHSGGGAPADLVPYCSHMACSKYNGQSGACSELNGHMPNAVCLPQIREDLREAELLRNSVFLGPLQGKTAHDRIVELEAELKAAQDSARRLDIAGAEHWEDLQTCAKIAFEYGCLVTQRPSDAVRKLANRLDDTLVEVDSFKDASTPAFDLISGLCGARTWDHPGQVVRDVEAVVKQRDLYKESCDALEKGVSDLCELVRHAEAVRDDARTFSARDLELRRAQARELDSMRDERDGALRRELENRETHAQQRAELRESMLFWQRQSDKLADANLVLHDKLVAEARRSIDEDRRQMIRDVIDPPEPEPIKAKHPPSCRKCNDRGVIETGNNDLPCECPAGDHALFNTGGATKTGAQIKAER